LSRCPESRHGGTAETRNRRKHGYEDTLRRLIVGFFDMNRFGVDGSSALCSFRQTATEYGGIGGEHSRNSANERHRFVYF
jgi:hypothetical protein